MALSPDDFIAVPKEWLREILCSDPPQHIFGMRPVSKVSSVDFTPKIIRIELGRLLIAKDTDTQYYKVFIFEDTKHAEVWPKREWDESLSKRLNQVAAAAERITNDAIESERRQAIGNWIKLNMGIDPDSYQGKKLVSVLAKLTTMPTELAVFNGLEELLNKYGNLNKSAQPS